MLDQTLGLFLDVRTPSEHLVTGTIWFDEIAIRRDPASASGPIPDPEPRTQSQPRQRYK